MFCAQILFKGLCEKKVKMEEAPGWLVGWILWHINVCRLFKVKSIFIQILSSISNNSV